MLTRTTPLQLAVVLLVSACFVGNSSADETDRLWETLYADHLPEFCLYALQLPDKSPGKHGHPLATGKYAQQFGTAWNHLHHYCFGLQLTWESMTIVDDESMRRGNYSGAISEYDYVLIRAPDSFVLKPDIYVQKALAYEQLELYAEAAEAYTEAIRLNPRHVPAYVGLSQYFKKMGDISQAIALVEAGLRQVPDSEILLEQHLELTARSANPGP